MLHSLTFIAMNCICFYQKIILFPKTGSAIFCTCTVFQCTFTLGTIGILVLLYIWYMSLYYDMNNVNSFFHLYWYKLYLILSRQSITVYCEKLRTVSATLFCYYYALCSLDTCQRTWNILRVTLKSQWFCGLFSFVSK
jgi:hypothetical protein